MMRRFLVWTLALFLGIGAGSAAAQQPGDTAPNTRPQSSSGPDQGVAELGLYNAWVTGVGADVLAYLRLENTTSVGYTLISADLSGGTLIAPVAAVITEAVLLPAGAAVALTADGQTVRFAEAAGALATAQSVTLTLTFAGTNGATLVQTIGALVTDSAPEPPLIVLNPYAQVAPTETLLVIPGLEVTAEATPEAGESTPPALALYATLANRTIPTPNLINASVDFDAIAEIRESYVTEGGRIASRAIPFIPVPIGAQLLMRPNGYFVYLGGMTDAPAPGDSFIVTLIFDNGNEIAVPFVLRAPAN